MLRSLITTGVIAAMLMASLPAQSAAVPQAVASLTVRPPDSMVRLTKSRMVRMRDGVLLSADIYFPANSSGRIPAILIRTPYDKNYYRAGMGLAPDRNYPPFEEKSYWAPQFFAARGYAVIVQDLRGKFESEGEFFPYSAREGQDGYDTLSWIARQPWSNGKVGTYGCSYMGENQHMLAAARHPAHKAAIAQAGSSSYGAGGVWNFGFSRYGALELAAALSWNFSDGSSFPYGPPPGVDREQWFSSDAASGYSTAQVLQEPTGQRLSDALQTLPVINAMRAISSVPNQFENWLRNNVQPRSDYWRRQGMIDDNARFDLPTLHINSWYDITPNSTLKLFGLFSSNATSATGRDNQYLIMSAPGHCAFERRSGTAKVGDRPVGDASLNLPAIYLAWFDHWLKDLPTGIKQRLPKVLSFVLGADRWTTAPAWPLPGTVEQKWYLSSAGRANSRYGDGYLSTAPRVDRASSDEFTYDPMFPNPTVGGSVCCAGPSVKEGGADQRAAEMRSDVLVYTSEVLAEGVEVAGPVEAVLRVSSDAKDTDFVAKLVDVYPDGTAYIVQEGIIRARWRDGFDRPRWLERGRVYDVRIDMEATHNYFAPGHRIRLDISSSSFPRWDRNLNTGGSNFDEAAGVPARNRVHYDTGGSYLRLPVVTRTKHF